ncbi:MAG: hypothetical protein IJ873_01995 [Lachnospiraceae bacterium]|nr:hypothetical protein [Lachnospiraceae bacterium]MBR2274824.1 hypothetical protein [Lachnospiraceae bacterium]
MLQKLRYKLAQFMVGRYGMDQLSQMIAGVCFIFIVLGMFVARPVFSLLTLLLIILMYFRVFSRNISARYAENQKYLTFTARLRASLNRGRTRLLDLRTHHIYKCPSCGQKIRVPRGKGKIEISCPKCLTKFIKNS